MSWRPEGWFNPHLYFGSPHTTFDDNSNIRHKTYEAGADAGIKALVEWMDKNIIIPPIRHREDDGTFSIIPQAPNYRRWQALKEEVTDG